MIAVLKLLDRMADANNSKGLNIVVVSIAQPCNTDSFEAHLSKVA